MAAAAPESTTRLVRQTQLGDAVLNVPLAAVVIDPGTRTYLAVNDYMCRFSGYEDVELVGTPVSKLDANAADPGTWGRLEDAGVATGEGAMRRKDGQVVAVEYLASLTKVGNLEFVLCFFWARSAALSETSSEAA